MKDMCKPKKKKKVKLPKEYENQTTCVVLYVV